VSTSFRLILASIIGIIATGLATLNGGVMVLAIPLMVYLFVAIALRPEGLAVTVTRAVTPDHAPQGAPVTITLTLTNQGAAVEELTLRDMLARGMRKTGGESSITAFLKENATLEIEYTVTARRGEYDLYETVVWARDVFGLSEETLVFRTAPRLVIHPRYPKLDRIKLRPPQTRGFAGPIAARQGGTGIDFWGVREYHANDPQRQINWKLSARSERDLYTNIFEQERVADVGLILDARQRTDVVIGPESLFEHSVRATAALAENFLNDGNRVSLLVYGPGIARVFPGYGRIHRNRILHELSKADPGVNYALENLSHLPTRLFPAKSQLVVISPLVPEDIPALVRMRARGYAVMVISPDPISYESTLNRDTSSPAYRIAYAERTLMLRQMRRCGARIVNWQVDQPLEIAIRETLARQPLVVRNHRMRA
jgi:uncharacterized protein (DUF58 family)